MLQGSGTRIAELKCPIAHCDYSGTKVDSDYVMHNIGRQIWAIQPILLCNLPSSYYQTYNAIYLSTGNS